MAAPIGSVKDLIDRYFQRRRSTRVRPPQGLVERKGAEKTTHAENANAQGVASDVRVA